MNHDSATGRRVAIIGGGCAGLAAAHRIRELSPETQVTLFEAGDRLGGVIRTEQCGEYLVEHGPDMFTTKEPWALDLYRRLGIEGELINTNTRYARAFVVRRGRLCPVPEGFALLTPSKAWPIVTTSLLSVRGKLRLAAEYFVARRESDEDESLADFVTRRLGREVYERLVQPLIGGIYTTDPTKLSMQAALPQFVEMERKYGGLLRGMGRARTSGGSHRDRAAGARYGLFLAPRNGLQTMLDALAQRLPAESVRLGTPIESVAPRADGGWWLRPVGASAPASCDAVVVAIPAHQAARLLHAVDASLADELRQIPYVSASIVVCGYRHDQLQHPLDGFGLVVPIIENRRILAASFASVKFDGRAPDDRVLIRVFVGGALQPELAELPDTELQELAVRELSELLGATGLPELCRVIRWQRAMPQYHVGHLGRVARIEERQRAFPTLALAGNAYRGVGVPFCIHSGEQAAERILRQMGNAR